MERVAEYLNKYKYPIIGLLIFIVFNDRVLDFYNNNLVYGVLDTVENSNFLIDITIIISFLYFSAYALFRAFHGKKSQVTNPWYLALTLIYLYYRILSPGKWQLTTLTIDELNFVALSDIVLLPLTFAGFNYIVYNSLRKTQVKKARQTKAFPGFHSDSDIIFNGNDESNRYTFLLDLKQNLIATRNLEKSFAIGVVGKWGYGKTSFMNTLYHELDDNDFIKIKFNPWMYTPSQNITSLFLENFGDSIAEYDSSFRNDISKYISELLSDVDNNYLTIASKLIYNGVNIEEQYNKINLSIKRLNKRIIVFIDDIDRLDKIEVMEVLRLIRNTANFCNTFFVVAFDKSYIIQSLRGVIEYRSTSFLDKIFQLEYYLPPLSRPFLTEKLHLELEQILDEDGKKKLAEYLEYLRMYERYEQTGISDLPIETVREIYRYVNIFILAYKRLSGEVYFPDLYKITYLRLKFPEVYYLLYYRYNDILTNNEKNGESSMQTNYLRLSMKDSKKENSWENTHLFEILKKAPENYGIEQEDILTVVGFIYSIFPPSERYGFSLTTKKLSNNHLTINTPSSFNRYFDLSLQTNLSEIEFSKARSGDLDKFLEKVSFWKNNDATRNDLEERLRIITKFDNKEDYEKVIEAIVYFYSTPNSDGRFPSMDSTNMYKFIYEQMGGYDEENVSKTTQAYYANDKESYKQFIKRLILDGLKPGFLLALITRLIHSFPKFILTQEELKGGITAKFEEEILKVPSLYTHVWRYFHTIIRFTPSTSDTVEIHPDAIEYAEKMKKYLLTKALDEFLVDSVHPCRKANGMGYTVDKMIEVIWGTLDNFINDIHANTTPSEYREEFINFVNTYQMAGKNCIGYKFELIPTKV